MKEVSRIATEKIKLPPPIKSKLEGIVKQREKLKEKGLILLLTSESTTGKTMAANFLAVRLDLPLYEIDLSVVVSKYIGETEKNLNKVLSQAERMDCILLFDEADALFGKRTEVEDAHDRFAEKSLKRLSDLRRLIILSTRKKTKITSKYLRKFDTTISLDSNGDDNE